MKLSYCISTLNRSELLDNTLFTFTKQRFPKKEFEIVVLDDNSGKEVREVCEKYKGQINIHYIRVEHESSWRDCATGLNTCLRKATGEILAAGHPEIVLSPLGFDLLYYGHFGKYPLIFQNDNNDENKLCVLMQNTFLPEGMFQLKEYKTIPYPELVEKYDPGLISKLPNIKAMGNFVCMSMKATTWKEMGGFYEFRTWGGMDPDHQSRRHEWKVADVLIDLPDGICLHQWHPISQQSQEVRDGKRLLESRPWQEATTYLPFLSEEHDKEMEHEIVFEEYWPYGK